MWFGTHDGLNKYDGYTFTVYRHRRSDPDSLSNNTITALYQDHTGTLWIGTTVGLDSFAGGAPRFTHHPAVGEEIAAIYEDSSGTLWIGTAGSGLFRYDRTAGQFIHYKYDPADPHGLSDDSVISILEDDSGALWMGTANGGLNVLVPGQGGPDRATERFSSYQHDPADPHSLSHNRVIALYQDRAGALWIGTGTEYEFEVGGLNVFIPGQGDLDTDTGQFDHYLHAPGDERSLSNNRIKAIYEDQAGVLWIGTDDGLNVLDRATSTFTRYRHAPLDPHSLSSDAITAIYEDRAGTLWFGTDDQGINKYTRAREKFVRYQADPFAPNSLSDTEVAALYEDRSGLLWIGVAGEGLDSLDRKTGQYTHYTHDPDDPHSLSNNNVRALYQDHQGVLWVGTGRGLDRYRAAGQFDHYAHDPGDAGSLSQGAVKAILEDHTRTLWVATEEPGTINRFDRATETFMRYEHDPDDPNSFIRTYGVRTIYEDQAGDLWLGTYNGLVHFDRASEAFTQYRHNPDDPFSLSHDFVWSIHQDPDGILWIATAGGLNRLDHSTGRFSIYTMEHGLANDNIMCILTDVQGNLWMGTDDGLSRFDPRTETWRNYDESDGLTDNDFQLGSCHQSKSGEMFFGTSDGFNAFYPTGVQGSSFIPPIVLTAFRKFDEIVEFDTPLANVKEIRLSHEDNFFAFEFAALDYADSAKNQYAYKLQGFDKDWVDCGARRYAGYTGVPPGQYTFRVKGANSDGLWNEEGRAIRIIITPPFWETWWFKVAALTLLFGLVFWVIKARMQNVAVLRASEERFRMLFENAPLCVFELDMAPTTPHIIRANRRSERVYGWSPVEFPAISLQSMFAPDARPALAQMMGTLDVGKTVTIESTGLRRDGTAFPVRVRATGEPGPDLKLAILAIEDITAEKERRTEEEAIAEERRRIAREIHDGLAQDLAGLRFRVGLWHKLVDDDPGQMHAELDGLRALLSQKIRDVRRSIFALRPVALDELGFFPAIRQFTDEFGEQNQLHVALRVEGPAGRLPAFLEPVLFRIIQESLNNVGKHAQAQMAWIELDLNAPDAVSLNVRDDGVGFDPDILDQIVQRGHLGLKQMQERVENLKGVFELHSQPGGGTEVKIVLPLVTESHRGNQHAIHPSINRR
jgi:PAS domain S-box-containing protein